jgi:hypothetical protein
LADAFIPFRFASLKRGSFMRGRCIDHATATPGIVALLPGLLPAAARLSGLPGLALLAGPAAGLPAGLLLASSGGLLLPAAAFLLLLLLLLLRLLFAQGKDRLSVHASIGRIVKPAGQTKARAFQVRVYGVVASFVPFVRVALLASRMMLIRAMKHFMRDNALQLRRGQGIDKAAIPKQIRSINCHCRDGGGLGLYQSQMQRQRPKERLAHNQPSARALKFVFCGFLSHRVTS